jgi:hypothetical protein
LRKDDGLRVLEIRMLRRIFGPKTEVDGSWRKLYNDELHGLYSSPNIVRVIKTIRLGSAGHVTRMVEGRVVHRILVEGPKLRDHWQDLGVGGKIIVSWILGR